MKERRRRWTTEMDRVLVQHYDATVRGRSAWIADKLGVSRLAVTQRAQVLALSRPRDRPWTQEEEDELEAAYHRTPLRELARSLGRSEVAVQLKARRLGLRKNGEDYTASSLAQALGVDPHWVLARIKAGKLHGSRRHTQRECTHGRDSWLITDEDVVAFIKAHPYDIDLRKVDALWFLDLIAAWLMQPGRSTQRKLAHHQQHPNEEDNP